MQTRSWQTLLALVVLSSSCNFHDDKNNGGETVTTVTADQLNAAEVQARVFEPYCVACHSRSGGSAGGVNLETYAQIKAAIGGIQKEVLVKKSMPPSSPLKASASELLQKWIEQGAPETAP